MEKSLSDKKYPLCECKRQYHDKCKSYFIAKCEFHQQKYGTIFVYETTITLEDRDNEYECNFCPKCSRPAGNIQDLIEADNV